MKATKYILGILAICGLSACSDTEAPFNDEKTQGEGQLSLASINLQLNVDETIKVRSRSGNDDLLPHFSVYIINSQGQTEKYFEKYGDMPEIVTLPAGEYTVKAVYGEDKDAEWSNPYFVGQSSKSFTVSTNKITTEIDPVVCELKNVMVSVVFDADLLACISGEPVVEVKVNNSKSLLYTKSHSSNKTPGYFKHADVCTLTAEFRGTVDGVALKETKTLDKIEAGKHYRLTFKKHVYTGDESGQIESDVVVDATVEVKDLSGEVEVGEETILEDVTWPTENGDDNKDDEGNKDPDPEDPEDPELKGLTIALDPKSTVKIGIINNVTENDVVILNVHSDTGLTKFIVDIESETLKLTDVGADSNTIDLIEPGDMVETWQYLELLKDGKTTLKGETDVVFDITGFMPMLTAVDGEHHFIVTVGDEGDEKTMELILNVLKPSN